MEFKHFYKCQTAVNLLLSKIYDVYMKGSEEGIQSPYVPNYLFLEERLKQFSDNNLNFLNHLMSPKMYDYINKPRVLEMLAKCYVELKNVQINKLCEEEDIMDEFLYLLSVIDKTSEVEPPPSLVTAVIGREGSDLQSIWNKMNNIDDPYLAIRKENSEIPAQSKQSPKSNQSKNSLSSINRNTTTNIINSNEGKNYNSNNSNNDRDYNNNDYNSNDNNISKQNNSKSKNESRPNSLKNRKEEFKKSDRSLDHIKYVTSNDDLSSILSLSNKVLSRLPSVHFSEECLNREPTRIKLKNKSFIEEQLQYDKILKEKVVKGRIYNTGIPDDDQEEKSVSKKNQRK